VADTADRDPNRALRARFDDVFGHYQRLRSGLDDIQRRLAEMQVSAESADGLIRATVDSRGHLRELKLDPAVQREMDPDRLGREIVGAVREATARTTDQVREMMSGYLASDSGAMRFLHDNDFGSLLRRSDQAMHDG
jgi:DNA-binding protein YbaB